MSEIGDFGAIVLAVSATVFAALLGMRLADRFSVPYAALFLIAAALIAEVWTDLQTVLSVKEVERIAVVERIGDARRIRRPIEQALAAAAGPSARPKT